MVNDKTQFKRLVFTLVTLSLTILVVMASVGLLSWFAGLPDWGTQSCPLKVPFLCLFKSSQ